MSTPLDLTYVSHIREAIHWIESYLHGATEESFRNTKLIQWASTLKSCGTRLN